MFLIMGLRGGADCRESLLFEHKEARDKVPYPALPFLMREAKTSLYSKKKGVRSGSVEKLTALYLLCFTKKGVLEKS